MTTGHGQRDRVTPASGQRAASDVSVIAHRGFAGIHPENTLAAVAGAVADGRANTIEVDVMPTRDGSVVVFHDDDLARVTDAPASVRRKNVWELSYETIRRYGVLGTDETVPLLSTVLESIPADLSVNIELKNPGADGTRFAEPLSEAALSAATDRWRDFVADVLEIATASGHELLVSSFYEGALAATREVDPSVPIASVFWDSIEDGLEVTRRYDCEAVHLPWNMISGTELFNESSPAPGPFPEVDLIAQAHEEGRIVNAWTVKTWRQASELRRAGVDGVIADYPGLFARQFEIGEAIGPRAQ